MNYLSLLFSSDSAFSDLDDGHPHGRDTFSLMKSQIPMQVLGAIAIAQWEENWHRIPEAPTN